MKDCLRLTALTLLGVALASCSGVTRVSGVWAGQNIELRATSDGATIRFACAVGTIDEPILPDSSGRFDVTGSYTIQAGPVPIGGYLRRPARYSGVVMGNAMSLDMVVEAFTNGSFTLVEGGAPVFTLLCALRSDP